MTDKRSRRWATLLLVLGAVVFGMVLAGSLDWTPPGFGAVDERAAGAVKVPSGSVTLPSFAQLAEAVTPAVASIRSVSFSEAPAGRGAEGDPFFDFFFGPRRRRDGQGEREGEGDGPGRGPVPPGPGRERPIPEEFRSEAGGSGFLISADGLVATNYHVIEGASELMVQLGDDPREFPAKVRGTDPLTDLALIQIESDRRFSYLRLGDSARVRAGDWVMVIGNPLRLGRTVTVGVVSAVGRSGLGITDVSFENFLQTDAAINFGNSGGPMVNLQGEVVGIATAINWGAENVGFAVPASTLAKVLPQLEAQGRVRRGYLGVNVENVDYQAQQAFGLEAPEGALVIQVVAEAPAANAGIRHGDLILAVDGRKVRATRDLIDYVSDRPPGTQVTLELRRGDERLSRRVTVGERPGGEEPPAPPEEENGSGIEWLGLRYQDLSPGIRSSHQIPEEVAGVWIRSVSPRSPLIDERVQAGDIITEVNGAAVRSVADLERLVQAAPSGGYLRFYVQRFDPRSGRSAQLFAFARVP
jgi:serine protease Do